MVLGAEKNARRVHEIEGGADPNGSLTPSIKILCGEPYSNRVIQPIFEHGLGPALETVD